jgi:hypothetical protein
MEEHREEAEGIQAPARTVAISRASAARRDADWQIARAR